MTGQHPPFLIIGLPRSRTYWLSRFLSYRDWTCAHEEARHMRSLEDVRAWFRVPRMGAAETAIAPFWRLVTHVAPEARIVVIRRPVGEVVDSLIRTGIPFDRDVLAKNLRRMDAKLDQTEARVPGCLSVRFHDLKEEEACARVFEHCLPYQHDHEWWAQFAPVRLTCNLPNLINYALVHAPQLKIAAAQAAREIRAAMFLTAERSRVEPDGITIAEEPFEQFWRDGEKLFAEHCVDVGESADSYLKKNVDLMMQFAAMGKMHVVTARSNGRMLGYLGTVTGPSIEDPALSVGTQISFYVSRDAASLSLGSRLQRFSINSLKSRGGRWQFAMRAGVRGSGPRMGALFRRMGAEDDGHLYRLRMEGN